MNDFINTFTINNIHIVGVPTVQNVFNEFDEFGLLIGLPRFNGESIELYKKRLEDVYVNRASATYLGLINGITRELGLSLYNPLRIYPIKSGNTFIAENPIIVFNGPFIELWRDKENNILEMEIDRFNLDGDAYLINDLINFINSRSHYFRASGINNLYERSMCILNQTNIHQVRTEIIPQSEKFILRFPNINGGSIILSSISVNDSITFKTLVPNNLSVINDGDYYIDPYTGNVIVSSTPSPGTTITYSWIDYGFKPIASPVIIHNVESPNFKRQMFKQVLNDNGVYENGIPTEFGASIVNELLSAYPLLNGI